MRGNVKLPIFFLFFFADSARLAQYVTHFCILDAAVRRLLEKVTERLQRTRREEAAPLWLLLLLLLAWRNLAAYTTPTRFRSSENGPVFLSKRAASEGGRTETKSYFIKHIV